MIEKAWEMALDRDSVPALRMLVEHGWIPGLRCSGHDHRDPTFKGLSWGWIALLKNAGKCLTWALQMPQVVAMMADDAQRFPRKTVGAMQRATEPTLTLLQGMGVPLDTVDESGRRLLRRLAMWKSLTKPLVHWSLKHQPSLMVLRDEDGASPLDLLHQSDGALARWCEARLLQMEVNQTAPAGTLQPHPVRARL